MASRNCNGKLLHVEDNAKKKIVSYRVPMALETFRITKLIVLDTRKGQREANKANDAAEKAKDKEYRDSGRVLECSICFEETPVYKVIHCNSEKTSHATCFSCINDQAKSYIGDQKWDLRCPSTSDW